MQSRKNIVASVGRPEINMICVHGDQGVEIKGPVRVSGTGQDWRAAWEETARSR